MKHKRSLPNLNDGRSDISGFTTSSGGSYRLQRRNTYAVDSQGKRDVAQVTANFGSDLPQAFSGPVPRPPARPRGSTLSLATDPGERRAPSSVSYRRASSLAGDGYSHIVDRYTPKPYQKRIDVTDFKHEPIMLLPKVQSSVQTDAYSFTNQLRNNTVIPADPSTTMYLGGGRAGTRASSAVSSVSQISTDLEEDIQDTDDSGYIDSFVNLREVKKQRKDTLRAKFEAKLRRKRLELTNQKAAEPVCPRCQELYDDHGGKTNFLDWFWGRWEDKKNRDPFDSEVEENIRKVQQPHFCKFVKKIDLIGKDVDDAPSVASSRSRRSHDRKASSTRDSTDTPIRVWLGDDDDDGSTTVVGRIVKASSAVSLSSIVDAASLSRRLRSSSSRKSKTTAGGDESAEEIEEIDLADALQAIRSSSIKLSSDESDSSSEKDASSGRKSSRSKSRRSKSSRSRSGGEGSDYSSGSDSEFSEGGTYYSKKSSSRVQSAVTGSGTNEEDASLYPDDDEEEEEESEEESAFGNEELYTAGESHMEEAMLAFKYYDKKDNGEEPSIPTDKIPDDELSDEELTEEQIEQIAYRNASSLAMSCWTGNSAWKKPVRRYTLIEPVAEPTSEVESEEENKKPILGERPVFSKRRRTVHDPTELTDEARQRAAYVVAALPDARFRTRGSGLWNKVKGGASLFNEEEEDQTASSGTPDIAEEAQTEIRPTTPEIPPLPEVPEPEPEPEKPKKKKKNRRTHLIEDSSDPKKMEEHDYKFSFNFTDVTSTMDNDRKARMQSWLAGRLALSQQASRFELPMDMKRLETMSPEEYLSQFCVISSRRSTLYNKVFSKYKDKQGKVGMKDLNKALHEVLINTITSEEILTVLRLTSLEENSKVSLKLFSGLAAMAERLLYPKYVTDDTVDIPDHKKEKIEAADFSALKWKFQGVEVNAGVKKILEHL